MKNQLLTKQEILEAAYQWIKSNFGGGSLHTKSGDITLSWTKTDILECLQDLIKEDKATMSLADDYNAAMQKERDEAVNLLTAVCEHIEKYPASHCKYMFAESLSIHKVTTAFVKGLKEWWEARKPKSEREQKLEKVIRLIQDCTHSPNDSAEYLAERILTALEQ